MVIADWVAQAVREFGLSLGVTRLHINDQGVACVHIQNVGSLFIEPQPTFVITYLARDFGQISGEEMKQALALTHPLEQLQDDCFVGMRGEGQLVFGVRIPENDFSLSRLERTLGMLRALMDRIRER